MPTPTPTQRRGPILRSTIALIVLCLATLGAARGVAAQAPEGGGLGRIQKAGLFGAFVGSAAGAAIGYVTSSAYDRRDCASACPPGTESTVASQTWSGALVGAVAGGIIGGIVGKITAPDTAPVVVEPGRRGAVQLRVRIVH